MIEKLYLSEDFKLIALDQSILPFKKKFITCNCFDDVFNCIKKKQINGYSLLPVTLMYGLCIDLMKFESKNKKNLRIHFSNLIDCILKIDPHNQILKYCINRIENLFELNFDDEELVIKLIELVEDLYEEDAEISKRIALNGSDLIAQDNGIILFGNGNQFNTCGDGISVGIIKESAKQSKDPLTFILETRIDIINSKLNAYDLKDSGLSFSILPGLDFADLFRDNSIDCVLLTAKNVSSDGSFISDSGAYNLAVNCKYHKIPLFVAVPSTAIYFDSDSLVDLVPEEIDEGLLNKFEGIQLYPDNYSVSSLSENIINPEFVTAFITENKIHYPPFNFNQIKHTFRSYINSLPLDSQENNS